MYYMYRNSSVYKTHMYANYSIYEYKRHKEVVYSMVIIISIFLVTICNSYGRSCFKYIYIDRFYILYYFLLLALSV